MTLARARAAAVPLLIAALPCACLEDLAEPVSCPPDAKRPVSGCLTLPAQILPGCWTGGAQDCWTGGRLDCSCGAAECPLSEDGCYPDDDCPRIVKDRVAGTARCLPISSDRLVWAAPPGSRCPCGCERCMARCDGEGPVVAVTTQPMVMTLGNYVLPAVFLDSLPAAGSFGVYVRVRGVGFVGALFQRGQAQDPLTWQTLALDTGVGAVFPIAHVDEQFGEYVLYDNAVDGSGVLSWSSVDEQPQLVSFFAPESSGIVFEIDCIVPFVVE